MQKVLTQPTDLSPKLTIKKKKDKMYILNYYIFEKVYMFRDEIIDDDEQKETPEAIQIFNDPFAEELLYDVDVNSGLKHSRKFRNKDDLNIITGSYEQDIKCLIEPDMLHEVIEQPLEVNNRLKQLLDKHENDSAE